MSYLGFPRIHFAGTFFTNPGNLNNQTVNFEKAADGQPLIIDTGRYNNPKGVAQYFFRACQITQIVGADGQVVGSDPLLGAAVETVNPYDLQADAQGKNYTLAKIADLDPDMQFRSELYGLRLFVGSAGGVGFSGPCDVPQLRDLFFGRGDAGVAGLQVACGTWHQRLHVEQVSNPNGASAVLASLGLRAGSELDVKLSVDMFQTSPAEQFTTGNMYCYGRLMGTIGSVDAGDPQQIVPGRRLYSAMSIASLSSPAPKAAAASAGPILTRHAAEREAAAPAASAAAVPFWNNTDARVVTGSGRSCLLVDMGTATPLRAPSNGTFDVGSSLVFGYLQGGTFVPFESQGTLRDGKVVSVSSQLGDNVSLPAAAQFRDSAYLRNAGVVQLDLTSAEAKALGSSPLCVQSDGSSVLQENATGYYVNTEAAACRMQPNESLASGGQAIHVVAYQFGAPVPSIAAGASSPGDKGLVLELDRVVVEYGADAKTKLAQTSIFTVELASQPISGRPGQFQLTMATGVAQSLAKNEYRRPMDSLLCFLRAASKGSAVGENPGTQQVQPYMPFVALLFWQNQKVVAQPTWQANIEPILRIYARLYPGMAGLIDIGDEATVKANASGIEARLQLAVADPGFMPVVRDMSPATSAMLCEWLKQQAAISRQGGA
jgi:hypothetical protein